MDRYNRHIILPEIGPIGQAQISAAKVLVIGAGGLGCPVLQYLAAAGVGTIGIVDFDIVELSNLQRQILYGSSSLGTNKAIAAKERLEDLNSTIKINAYPYKMNYQNALGLFRQYDLVVDGTDSIEVRYLINDACVLTDKAFVFGAVYKFQGQVSVFNYNNGPSYRCAFPQKAEKSSTPNCSEIGVLGVLPGIIGTMQANEVLKIILGRGDVLSGHLLCYDALSAQVNRFSIQKNEQEIKKVLSNGEQFSTQQMDAACELNISEVSIVDYITHSNVQLIDVREPDELPGVDFDEVTKIPLSILELHFDKIKPGAVKLLFCQSGVRSKQAVLLLKSHNLSNCYSLKEAASEIKQILTHSKKPILDEQ